MDTSVEASVEVSVEASTEYNQKNVFFFEDFRGRGCLDNKHKGKDYAAAAPQGS